MTPMKRYALSRFSLIVVLSVALVLIVAGCAAPPRVEPTLAPSQPETTSPTTAGPTDTPALPTPVPTEVAMPTETTSPQDTPVVAPSTTSVTSTTVAGRWEGEIALPGTALEIVVVFEDQDGQLSGQIRIPAQLAADIPLHDIRIESPKLHFEMLSGPQLAVFDGELLPDGSLGGSFTQSGYEGEFTLKPAPATPAEVVPYRQEEVTFENGDITLAGTLTLPEGDGPFPAVLLLTGSGQQNRDEEISIAPGYKPFRVLADTLTRQGIAVLRYDDRGIGQSGGDPAQATTIDFTDDAEAGFNMLLAHPEIDPKQVGLLGHSEGGIIAATLAARNPDVAFVIGMGAPGVSGYDILLTQVERIARASGASEAEATRAVEQERQILDLVMAKDWQALEDSMYQTMLEQIQAMPQDQQTALGDPEEVMRERILPQIEAMKGPWFQNFLTYDIGQDWAKITVPVLALFGGLDVQVDADQNSPALNAALEKAKNSDVTVKLFPKANHLFQEAVTGSVEEYATLPTDFVPGFLDTIADWLLERVKTDN